MDFVELMQSTLSNATVTVSGRDLLSVFERYSARSHRAAQEALLDRASIDKLTKENEVLRNQVRNLERECGELERRAGG